MSFYKSIERELKKLEDPSVTSIKLQKDPSRTVSSFRSTCYNVASRCGIPVRIENVSPNVYEISRAKKDVVSAFTGEIKVSKEVNLLTFNFNPKTLAGCLLLLSENLISKVEFVSYSVNDVLDLKSTLEEMGLADLLGSLMLENTENSLIIRVKTEFDRLAEPDAPHQTPVSP